MKEDKKDNITNAKAEIISQLTMNAAVIEAACDMATDEHMKSIGMSIAMLFKENIKEVLKANTKADLNNCFDSLQSKMKALEQSQGNYVSGGGSNEVH